MGYGLTDSAYYTSIASAIRDKFSIGGAVPASGMATILGTLGKSKGLFEMMATASLSVCECSAGTVVGYAFMGIKELTTVSLPACTTVGSYAFYSCSRLTTVSLPACTTVGKDAFESCSSLTTVSLPACKTVGSYAFNSCSRLTTVSLPACTTVGSYAFYYCSSLTTISLPVCTTISSSAFRSCHRLVSLYLNSVTSVPTLGGYAFTMTPIGGYSTTAGRYGSVYVPASLVNSFKTAYNWSAISARIVGV